MKKLLLYSTNVLKTEQIKKLCISLKINVHILENKDLTENVGTLLGISVPKSDKTLPPLYSQPEIMIISGLSKPELEAFLEIYKKAGIAPIDLKAVATPVNIMQTVFELTSDLKKEYAALSKNA